MLTRALLSAATVPSVPSWPTLSRATWDGSHRSEDPAALQDRMLACLAQHRTADPWWLPWAPDAALSLTRLCAALIGRADDVSGALPVELLPVEARALMDDLAAAADRAGLRERHPAGAR